MSPFHLVYGLYLGNVYSSYSNETFRFRVPWDVWGHSKIRPRWIATNRFAVPRLPGFDCAFGRVFSGSKPSLRVRYTNRTARFAFQYLGNAYSWYLDVTYPGMCVWGYFW